MLIREIDRLALLEIFDSIHAPMEVWAYGSRVKGNAHEGSDLDLVLRSESLKPIPLTDYTNLCEKIKNSNIPILVELRDWAMLPESFHNNILEQHEILFSNFQTELAEPKVAYHKSSSSK